MELRLQASWPLAGLWNALVLTHADLSRVIYLALPQALPSEFRGKVIIARVTGMDAASKKGFEEAMRELGTFGRDLLDGGAVPADEPFRFYLSGGFKAAIPYLIGLAEGLRSLNPRRPVHAYVLHDSAPDDTERIELPLRYLIADQVRNELSHFVNGVRKKAPDPALLRGYAYDIIGGQCRMSEFGAGLHALFGFDKTSVGG